MISTVSSPAAVSLAPVARLAPQQLGFLTINGTKYKVTLENANLSPSADMADVLQKIHMIAKTQLASETRNDQKITINATQTIIGTSIKSNTLDVVDFADDHLNNDKYEVDDGRSSSAGEQLISKATYDRIKTSIRSTLTSSATIKCSDVFQSILTRTSPSRSAARPSTVSSSGSDSESSHTSSSSSRESDASASTRRAVVLGSHSLYGEAAKHRRLDRAGRSTELGTFRLTPVESEKAPHLRVAPVRHRRVIGAKRSTASESDRPGVFGLGGLTTAQQRLFSLANLSDGDDDSSTTGGSGSDSEGLKVVSHTMVSRIDRTGESSLGAVRDELPALRTPVEETERLQPLASADGSKMPNSVVRFTVTAVKKTPAGPLLADGVDGTADHSHTGGGGGR